MSPALSSMMNLPSHLPSPAKSHPARVPPHRLSCPLIVNGLSCSPVCTHTHSVCLNTRVHTPRQCTGAPQHMHLLPNTRYATHVDTCKHVCILRHMQVHAYPHMHLNTDSHGGQAALHLLCCVHCGFCCLYPELQGLCTVSLAPLSAHGYCHLCCS